jgi:predicted Zn-dependent protease
MFRRSWLATGFRNRAKLVGVSGWTMRSGAHAGQAWRRRPPISEPEPVRDVRHCAAQEVSMRHSLARTIAAVIAVSAVGACAYNPQLGRNQLLLVDDSALAQAGQQAWNAALSQGRISRDPVANARVRQVASRVIEAAGMADRPWEYVVFQNDDVNAFVVPGGRIGVTTGLLRLVQNDDQLAAVIGHEVAHSVANHAEERYSQTAATQLVLAGAQGVLGGSSPEIARAIGSFGGAGAQVGILLPFSRRHELEADRLGVEYVARAGYRPAEALELWRLMANARNRNSPEFLSTHPSDATRLAALEAHLRTRGWL